VGILEIAFKAAFVASIALTLILLVVTWNRR
jgi:hypothetical protein